MKKGVSESIGNPFFIELIDYKAVSIFLHAISSGWSSGRMGLGDVKFDVLPPEI